MTLWNRRSILMSLIAALPLIPANAVSAVQAPTPRLRFEIIRDARSGFRWRLQSANGRIVADSSESYKTKTACLAGIDLVQRGAARAPIVDLS